MAELIDQRFKTATALAAAVGMKLSPFTRGVAAGTLNLVNLLNLAKAAQAEPSIVLRLAGKTREADLFEELYGPEKKVTDPLLQELLSRWATFTADEKAFVRTNVGMLLNTRRPHDGEPSDGARKKRRSA